MESFTTKDEMLHLSRLTNAMMRCAPAAAADDTFRVASDRDLFPEALSAS